FNELRQGFALAQHGFYVGTQLRVDTYLGKDGGFHASHRVAFALQRQAEALELLEQPEARPVTPPTTLARQRSMNDRRAASASSRPMPSRKQRVSRPGAAPPSPVTSALPDDHASKREQRRPQRHATHPFAPGSKRVQRSHR